MAIKLTIGGVEKTFAPNSLSIGDELNTRTRCSFRINDESGEYYPETGAVVRVEEEWAVGEILVSRKLFEGTLDEPEESMADGVQNVRFIKCEAVSYDQLCDRYHVQAVYSNITCAGIIKDAFTNPSHCKIHLENIDATEFVQQGGEPIEKLVANYITVADLLNDLSKLTGYKWFVDSERKLHFFDRTTKAAPFALTDPTEEIPDPPSYSKFKLRRTRQDYRNVQIVRGGTTITDPQTDYFAGDNHRKTFTLSYPVAEITSIKVRRGSGAWVEQIVAVQGTEGAEWVYLKGSPNITQTQGNVLGTYDQLEVVFVGEFPIMYEAPQDDEIDARREIEGGGGVYEHVDFDDSIESRETAERKALHLLDAYAKIPRVITFDTTERGLLPGQALRITLAQYRLDDEFLITRVDTKDQAGKHLFYTVHCVGSEYDSWVQYFRDAFRRPKRLVARENETLLLLRSVRSRSKATHSVSYTRSGMPSYIDDATELGFAEIEDFTYAFICGGMVVPSRI